MVRFRRNGLWRPDETHGPPDDLLNDWGRLRVPVVFPPNSDIDDARARRILPCAERSQRCGSRSVLDRRVR